jgi:D-beta-D-heptose 7-phosphate kinase / D-beta-D-heptose 1-phosphate adenosyltransferase
MRMSGSVTSLLQTAVAFSNAHVVVLGDVMLDRFVTGEVDRISPEAPIPVIRVGRQESVLGGAGNVACNVVRLGGHAILIGVLGDDDAGEVVEAAVACELRLSGELVREVGRRTIIKTRFVAQGQQLLRVDEETVGDVDGTSAERLLASLESALRGMHVLVCSDYAKGVLTPSTLSRAISLARANGAAVIVDPKARDLRRYVGATIITPNAHEAALATGVPCEDDGGVGQAARMIADTVGCDAVIVTRGAKGMTIFSRPGGRDEIVHLPTEAREVHDVSGAGDTVTAVLALALAGAAPLETAARLANVAAGIAVSKVATGPVEAAELAHALQISGLLHENAKVVPLDAASSAARAWQLNGHRVVFTNGCFDLLHPGHVRLLEKAKAHGDKLIVALNSDDSVKRLKGPSRPIQNESARATVMASIGVVDLVTVFTEDTPLAVIEAIRPDVLVKGADYTEDQVVGAEILRAYGGRVVLVPLDPGHSTTRAIVRAASGLEGSLPNDSSDDLRPFVFLDRDGTINVDRHYLSDPAGLALLPGAARGLRALAADGYRLVIATNQSGVGRGYFTARMADDINARLIELLAAEAVPIEMVVACYHKPEDNCHCRKPARGLADRVCDATGASLAGAIVIGNKKSDMGFAKAIGARGILITPTPEIAPDCGQMATARDLSSAAIIVAAWNNGQ